MKTSDLTGPALDWAVAKCEGFLQDDDPAWEPGHEPFSYSTDWSQGGPIIEREGMTMALDAYGWEARHYDGESEPWVFVGPTPLIAAMRCYVASCLGDEVEIPKELK